MKEEKRCPKCGSKEKVKMDTTEENKDTYVKNVEGITQGQKIGNAILE